MTKTTSKWGGWLQKHTDEDKQKEEIMPSLPDDIIMDIFSRLPAKSISRFRCVCKNWRNNLFKDPNFTKTHLKKSITSRRFGCFGRCERNKFHILNRKSSQLTTFEDDCFDPVNVVDIPIRSQRINHPNIEIYTHGSCNGFILMRTCPGINYAIDLFLWNPTRKECKEIELDSRFEKRNSRGFQREYGVAYGLGYNNDMDDYKIVRANGDRYYGSEVQVYTLSSNSWKTLPSIVPYEMIWYTRAFVSGALHWIATTCPKTSTDDYSTAPQSRSILSFDIKGEKFTKIPLASQVEKLVCSYSSEDALRSRITTLGDLGGCLCVVFSGPSNIEVWVMKDHKVKESWTQLFIAQLPTVKLEVFGYRTSLPKVEEKALCYMTLLWELDNGDVLFKAHTDYVSDRRGDIRGTFFVVYNSVHQKTKAPKIYRISEYRYNIEAYVESLVSHSGTSARWEQEFPTLQSSKQVSKASLIGSAAN